MSKFVTAVGTLAASVAVGVPTQTLHDASHIFDNVLPSNQEWSFARHQPYSDPTQGDPEGWTWVDVPGTTCMDGESTGYYYRAGASKTKFVTYLMPGGACFNALCTTLATSDPKGAYPPSSSGIYNQDSDNNALKDHTWLFIPYCTGDVFSGDARGRGGYADREFRGFNNLKLTMAHFHDFATREGMLSETLDSFVLTGESAGGFGAVAQWDYVRENYVKDIGASNSTYWTSSDNVMISDSGVIMDDGALKPCLQKNWRERWNAQIPESCTECTHNDGGGFGNIYDYLYEKYPNDRFGFLSTNEDQIISAFLGFGLVKNSFGSKQCGNLPALTGAAKNFREGLTRMFESTGTYANFCHYFFPGKDHTHTTQDSFFEKHFTTNDLDDDKKVFLYEWYNKIINNEDMAHCNVEHGLF